MVLFQGPELIDRRRHGRLAYKGKRQQKRRSCNHTSHLPDTLATFPMGENLEMSAAVVWSRQNQRRSGVLSGSGVFPGALGPTTATMVRRVPQIFFILRLGLISRDSCGLGRGRLLKQEMTPICRRISKPLPLHYYSPLRVGEASGVAGQLLTMDLATPD